MQDDQEIEIRESYTKIYNGSTLMPMSAPQDKKYPFFLGSARMLLFDG